MYYKVLVEGGHLGAGKSYDVARYIKAQDFNILCDALNNMPRIKGKGALKGVREIVLITEEEFRIGKRKESEEAYLMRR